MQSKEERFVEKWIGDHVGAEGYEAGREKASDLEDRLMADAKAQGFTKDQLEAEVGDLTERLHRGLTAATEDLMMARDGRTGYPDGMELLPEGKKEALEEVAAKARAKE